MIQMCVTGQWEFVTVLEEFVTAHGELVTVLREFCYICIFTVYGEFVTA